MNASKEDPVGGDQDGKQYFSITKGGQKILQHQVL